VVIRRPTADVLRVAALLRAAGLTPAEVAAACGIDVADVPDWPPADSTRPPADGRPGT
jgi:hypothetical protein